MYACLSPRCSRELCAHRTLRLDSACAPRMLALREVVQIARSTVSLPAVRVHGDSGLDHGCIWKVLADGYFIRMAEMHW